MGKRRLEDALKQLNHPIEVTYRSYELDPTMGRDIKESMYETLAKKYGMSIAQAKANVERVVQMAKEVGLDYQMDTLIQTNTFDAHRLTLYAKTQGRMKEMTERILRAYFTESKHIGDHETLTELAVEVGLHREEVAKMLASDEMSDVVRADEQTAKQYGVTGVPFFLINKKYALTGAQSTETVVQALRKVIAEDEITVLNSQDGLNCDDDGCEIP
ncbi:DsbA family oxidoreductase [Neobacillus sp. 179-C4.2 HS]|uniref:DsbA family oxidoreductase n=1 Tax=Neobacillus driksii TaxID=3035913 RepID=A0ABV4YRI2_9BACI|nr:DsbA family oxidoreductase [Neobacillus sp. 179.-C4.2 HS]MDP5195453.1 DsbA family oxidoreductase [Neobacillus sp. 179.-C4.2 HS]